MVLNIQLIDENNVILPNIVDMSVKINDIQLLPNNILLAEFQYTFTANAIVKIEINYSGRRRFVNTFNLLDFDLGNSVGLGITTNTPFQILLAPIQTIERTKVWEQDTIAYSEVKSVYWDNYITLINPTPYTNKTFNKVAIDGSVNPPFMVLVNKANVDSKYYYGVPTNTYDNALSLGEILDYEGNVISQINNTSITGNPEYTYRFIFPNFISYKNIATNEIHFYMATSSIHDDVSYSIDGELFGNGENVIKRCLKEGCDLIFRQTLSLSLEDECRCCDQKVIYAEYKEIDACIDKYFNAIEISIVQSKGCISGQCEYYIVGEPITIRTSVTINTPYIMRDNVCVPYCSTGVVTYRRYDKNNVLIETKYDTVSLDSGCNTTTVVNGTYTFTPAEVSEERIEVDYEDCYTKCKAEGSITYCNAYKFIQYDCDNLIIENCTLNRTITVTITDINTNSVIVNDSIIPALNKAYKLNNGVDGTYVVAITDNTSTKYYPVYNFCNIRECALSALSQVTCKECEGGDCAKENKHDFRKLFLFGLMYFSYLEKDLAMNYAYTSLSTALMEDLTTANTWLKRIQEICTSINNCGEGLNICGCNDKVNINRCKTC